MEIEAKFTIPGRKTYLDLQSLVGLDDYTLSSPTTTSVNDEYLDTTDRSLLSSGFACRIRHREDNLIITVKGLGKAKNGIHRREEYEFELDQYRPPADWPDGPARERVLQASGDAILEPLFRIAQKRQVRQICQHKRMVAELSLDEVHVMVADRQQTFYELEVELAANGDESDLAELAAHLQTRWHLAAEPRSKFERGLALLDETARPAADGGHLLTTKERPQFQRIADHEKDTFSRRALALLALDTGLTTRQAGQQADLTPGRVRHWRRQFLERGRNIFPDSVLERHTSLAGADRRAAPDPTPSLPAQAAEPAKSPGLLPDDTMTEAVRKTLWFHYQRMLRHEPGTRKGTDIDALHDMRVATRRMRFALKIAGDHLDKKTYRRFNKGLRRTARALGWVRDLDVFWEKTDQYLAEQAANQDEVLAPLQAIWAAEREAARKAMLDYLDSKAYRRLQERIEKRFSKPDPAYQAPFDKKGLPQPHYLRHLAPVTVYQRLAVVLAYNEYVTPTDAPPVYLHQLRIACKGLRYTLEFFQEILGPEVHSLIGQIKILQNHLGDLQDALVASGLLRRYLFWGTWDQDQIEGGQPAAEPTIDPGATMYLAYREAEYQRLRENFLPVWQDFKESDFKQTLAGIIAAL